MLEIKQQMASANNRRGVPRTRRIADERHAQRERCLGNTQLHQLHQLHQLQGNNISRSNYIIKINILATEGKEYAKSSHYTHRSNQ